ncbi:hypothetical protein V6N13_065183 [Hibiscus sabdariffa]|uniref:Uncharacterized protein n=1 Tax=Hibiscus sabdariffa TaxID=183260 RepID=A0ABR2QRJ3_9ROSI
MNTRKHKRNRNNRQQCSLPQKTLSTLSSTRANSYQRKNHKRKQKADEEGGGNLTAYHHREKELCPQHLVVPKITIRRRAKGRYPTDESEEERSFREVQDQERLPAMSKPSALLTQPNNFTESKHKNFYSYTNAISLSTTSPARRRPHPSALL